MYASRMLRIEEKQTKNPPKTQEGVNRTQYMAK